MPKKEVHIEVGVDTEDNLVYLAISTDDGDSVEVGIPVGHARDVGKALIRCADSLEN